MTRIIYLFAFFSFLAPRANSQKIIQATTFAWAGGQCCVTGNDYTVTIEIKGKFDKIEGVQFILKKGGNVYGRIYPVSYHNDITIFQVFMRTSIDHNEIRITEEILPSEDYLIIGQAFIQLKMDNDLYEIIVPEFLQLAPVAYP